MVVGLEQRRGATWLQDVRLVAIAAYAVLACVYWLPGVPSSLIAQLKMVAFAGLVVVAIPMVLGGRIEHGRVYILLAFAAAAAFVTVMRTGELGSAVARARDFIQPMLWLMVLASIPVAARGRFIRIFGVAVAVSYGLTVYTFLAQTGIAPNFAVPSEFFTQFGSRFLYLLGAARVSTSGFNSGSTGWGPPLVFTGLLFAAYLLRSRRSMVLPIIVLGVTTFTVAQTGARGASVALLVAAGSWVLFARGARIVGFAALAFFASVAAVIDWRVILPTRFFRDSASVDILTRLDYITTGRMTTYIRAVEQFLSSPLVGVGDARVSLSALDLVQIHNVWLRAAAEGGLLLLLPLAALAGIAGRLAVSTPADAIPSGLRYPNARPVVVAGLLLTLIEPNMLFGSFNNNVLIWTAIWLVLEERSRVRRLVVRHAGDVRQSRPLHYPRLPAVVQPQQTLH